MNFGASLKEAVDSAVTLDRYSIARMGSTLIVAPHPDDESLGCGGLISLLTAGGNQVRVLFVTDGSQSHPGSKKYPAPALASLREGEALEALSHLHMPPINAHFLRLPDAALPIPGNRGFESAVHNIQEQLIRFRPQTVVLPWRRDPHPDHRASWQLLQTAVNRAGLTPVLLEYPLWLWERGVDSDLPVPGEVVFHKVDISACLAVKQQAIAAHRSQISNLIDDDPRGFQLSASMLAHFDVPYEIYLSNQQL